MWAPKKDSVDDTLSDKDKHEPKVDERLRDAKVGVLTKVTDDAEYASLKESLLKEYPGHLPILREEVTRAEKADDVVRERAAAEAIVAAIDRDQLAIYVAKKSHEGEEEKLKQDMKMNKEALITSLTALARLDITNDVGSAEAKASWKLLTEWVAPGDKSILMLSAKKEIHDGRYAMAVKSLNKIIDADDSVAKDVKEAMVRRRPETAPVLPCHHVTSRFTNSPLSPSHPLTLSPTHPLTCAPCSYIRNCARKCSPR